MFILFAQRAIVIYSSSKRSALYVRTNGTKQTVHNIPITPNVSHSYTMLYQPVIVSKYRFVTVTII